MNTTYKPVLRVPENLHGRDFVVGDIHGAYDSVIHAMRKVRFNTSVDRLFCTGDLIDRGAGSFRALKFLERSYVYSAQGNHDYDFCQYDHQTLEALAILNWNGMAWVKTLSQNQIEALQAKLSQLPIAIEIPTPRGLVGIIHGDVPAQMNWHQFTEALEAGNQRVIETALTGRERVQGLDESGVHGVDRVFVGHTIKWDGPQRLSNVFAIDTGAIFAEISRNKDVQRGNLTLANICTATKSLTEQQPSSGLFISDEPVSNPFSAIFTQQGCGTDTSSAVARPC